MPLQWHNLGAYFLYKAHLARIYSVLEPTQMTQTNQFTLLQNVMHSYLQDGTLLPNSKPLNNKVGGLQASHVCPLL